MRWRMREERKPILEDEDPFARPSAFSSLPLPRSPLPFSAVLSLGPPKSNLPRAIKSILSTPETASRISVASEPVTPRNTKPLIRHPQYSEYASTTNTTGGSELSSYLFRSAPFPPIRELVSVNGQPMSRAARESAPSPPAHTLPSDSFREDSLDESDRSSSNSLGKNSSRSSPTTSVISTFPRIHLSRSTSKPLFPGSTFPFCLAVSSLNHPPSPSDPLLVSISFVGYTSASTHSTSTHLLFELESSIDLTESTWIGNVTIPIGSTCLSCGTTNVELPWSFYHREEDGREWETKYEIVASCDGFVEGRMEIEIGARLSLTESRVEKLRSLRIVDNINGWKLETEPQLNYRISMLDEAQLPLDLDPSTRIAIYLSLISRFSPTSTTTTSANLDSLISAMSPTRTSVSLRSVLRIGETGEAIPLGARWRNREDEFAFRVTKNEDGAVTASYDWVIDSRAVALAYMSSCARFAVEFELTIRFTSSSVESRKPPGLELIVPFPSLSKLSSPTSLSPPHSIPDNPPSIATELPNVAFFTESPSIAEEGEIARQRWAKLRRIFSIRRIA